MVYLGTASDKEFVSPSKTSQDWATANTVCQGLKMDVAVVTKDDINKSPIDKLPANLQVWTALYRHDLNYWTNAGTCV